MLGVAGGGGGGGGGEGRVEGRLYNIHNKKYT